MSQYITTFSKIRFNPTEPKISDILIEDIAHALSLMCRANGHFPKFFSVAQHSINCYYEAKARGYSNKVQLACLLHDSSEAYISDITRPVKAHLPQYLIFEKNLQDLIWNKFLGEQLNNEEIKQVFEIDDVQLRYEFLYFMDEKLFKEDPKVYSKPDFLTKDFIEAEMKFLSIFRNLVACGEKDFKCVGIDGCKGEWIAVAISEDCFEVEKFKTIQEICHKYHNADSILIDIPIGLPESKNEAVFRPDSILRTLMKGKASSVFSVPCRQAVYEDDKQKAKQKNIITLGKSLSEQSLAIRKAIRQVDRFIQTNPTWKNKLKESHPEYAFTILNNGKPILDKKTEELGIQNRIDILRKYCSKTDSVIHKYKSAVPNRKRLDDVLDALCLAVIGELSLKNGFVTIPEKPQNDSTGLKMQIVVANHRDGSCGFSGA